ncbi:unnamed protein product [Paramecium sonneborni]|uniref:Protein kinase domain-containing protein n=1 Tax=Paramecium sonneborni TaxID=65129 RepID=A0A8S1N2F1_9CILI|nr:unnamed protein product [Paramecium sonneborni]
MKLDINCCEDDDIMNQFSENGSLIFQGFRLNEKGIKYHKQCKKDQKQKNITLNDFELVTKLGQGGFGSVEKVQLKGTQELYALKKIKFLSDTNQEKLLTRELDALISCESDFIVQCYGAFYSQGYICIWLEYMDLGSLDKLLQKDGLIKEPMMMMITYKILQGLDYLHYKHKIIHRDIKPHNILINSEGNVKIADFGICQTVSTGQYLNTYIGTAIYMSPERLQSMNYGMDADIWSLGIMLIECLSGQHPFKKKDYSQIQQMKHIMEFDAEQYLQEYNWLPETKEIIFKCLHKDPKQRPSVKELLLSKPMQMAKNINEQVFHQWLKLKFKQ